MMKRIEFIYLLTGFCTICSCTSKANSEIKEVITEVHNTVTEAIAEIVEKDIKPEDIRLDKELLYDKHTLKDTYPYKDTTRHFQWEKIKERLALLENIRKKPAQWCILQNYKNRNGEAPLVKSFKRDAYKRIADTLGVPLGTVKSRIFFARQELQKELKDLTRIMCLIKKRDHVM